MYRQRPPFGPKPALLLLVLGANLLLSACQSGGNDPAASSTESTVQPSGCAQVTPGFSGNINATYLTASLASSTCTSLAAGGAQGKVLNGQLTVTRLKDGVVLGQAITDNVNGLVTVKVSPSDLPLLITLTGRSGAKYYDEGVDAMVEFGAGKEIHALLDSLDENIGVSPFTEAAYRYALNNFSANSTEVANGKTALLKTGNLRGLTLQQAKSANQLVLVEVNRHLVDSLQMKSLNSLPTPLDQASTSTSIPNNLYGVAATVIGGFVKSAATYQPTAATPALDASEQLARDLTDGKINGFALDGTPSAAGSGILYQPGDLAPSLDRGTADMSKQFGSETTYLIGPELLDLGNVAVFRDAMEPPELFDQFSLLKDGSLTVKRLSYSKGSNSDGSSSFTMSELPPIANFLQKVRQVAINNSYVLLSAGFAVKTDGTVWGWGNNSCGMLGNGTSGSGHAKAAVKLEGLSDITSVAVGRWFALARDKNGAVYSWGVSDSGEAAISEQARDMIGCDPATGGAGTANGYATDLRPKKIPQLKNIVSIAVNFTTSYALDDKGTLFSWNSTGRAISPPAAINTVSPATAITFAQDATLFLKADGTVWAQGHNSSGGAGDGTKNPKLSPTQVTSLEDIVEISGNNGFVVMALRRDGRVYYWDNSRTNPFANEAQKPQLVPESAGLPKIRHIAQGKYLYGTDNSIYIYDQASGSFVRK